MAKTRLLQAVCTVAMLAAAPVLAQTQTQPAGTGPDNSVNNPVADTGSTPGTMGSGTSMKGHPGHRSAMSHSNSRYDTSQNATVDQLNDQSYQAAHSGRTYQSGSGDMPAATSNGSTSAPGGGGKM